MATTNTSEREISITRIINAPRELVFKVWVEPEHVKKWWGPDGFTTTTKEMEVKPGGIWKFIMHGPDGTDFPNVIKFIEVVKPSRLHYEHSNESATDPVNFVATVTFTEIGKKTEVAMRMVFQTKEMRAFVTEKYGAVEGAVQHLGRLEQYLTGLPAN